MINLAARDIGHSLGRFVFTGIDSVAVPSLLQDYSAPVELRREVDAAELAFLARHDRALASGMSTYLDPASNWIVFTADYLAERGYCCSAGCRHCPWVDARFDA